MPRDELRDPWAIVVCVLVPFPVLGGGHKRTLRLLEAIDRAGVRPHLVTALDEEPAGAETLRRRGWGVDVVPEPPAAMRARARQHLARRPSEYLTGVAARLAELRAERPAFALVDQTQSAYYARLLAGIPQILSVQNVDSRLAASMARGHRALSPASLRGWNRWHSTRVTERRAASRADAVLCVSEADRAYFAAAGANAVLTPNGVDDEMFAVPSALPPGEEVLFFGQFDYPPNAHGIARFLREGWPDVAADRPGARLRLVGKGMAPALEALARAAPAVEVVGPVPDMAAELARARAVVAPLWQGGGTRIKVLETLAAGRPLAGTALGVEGLGVVPGSHALVEESPPALARALVTLLADETRATKLGRAGRELARTYRWEETLAPAEALFTRLRARSQ